MSHIVVFVADCHALYRLGLRMTLQMTGDIVVGGEYGSPEVLHDRDSLILPDVVIIEAHLASLPDLLPVLATARENGVPPRVIVVADDPSSLGGRLAGIGDVIVPRGISVAGLVAAVREVANRAPRSSESSIPLAGSAATRSAPIWQDLDLLGDQLVSLN